MAKHYPDHVWPSELTPDAECAICGKKYGDYMEETGCGQG